MARNYAQIKSDIWKDEHFKTTLGVDAQWMYFTLLSQPNLNGAGVLPLQDRRWRRLAEDLTADRVETALQRLQDHWYVLVDEDTEEVLIRSFIRNDGLWKQPNVLKSALGHAKNTLSGTLRAVIWHELERLPLHQLADDRAERTRTLIETLQGTLHGTLPEGFMEPPLSPPSTPFGGPEQANHAPVIPITRPAQENPQVNDAQPTLPRPLWEGFAEGFPEGSGVGAGVGEGAGESLGEELVPKTSSSGATPKKKPASKKKTPDPTTERAQAIAAPFWDTHKTRMAQSFISVRQVIKTALTNGVDENAITQALNILGAEARPVSGGTLQVALQRSTPARHAANGYQPYRNPENHDVYDEGLL